VDTQQHRIDKLEAKVQELSNQLAATSSAQSADQSTGGTSDIRPVTPSGSRRNLLKLAAGAAVGGSAVALSRAAGPVAAADGDSVIVGEMVSQGDSGPTSTVVDYENSDPPEVPLLGGSVPGNIMTVRDRQPFLLGNPSQSDYPAALGGYGYSKELNGMYGYASEIGYGVVGFSQGGQNAGILARGDRANVELYAEGVKPPDRTTEQTVGEVVADQDGALWYCVASGKPGVWRSLASVDTSGALHAIPPVRVYDSREGFEPLGVEKSVITAGTNRPVDCTVNNTEVPSDASAVMLTLTVADAQGMGNLGVYPDGSPPPATSSINYNLGVNIANTTMSACGPGAMIRVQCGAGEATDFVVDIVGYYR